VLQRVAVPCRVLQRQMPTSNVLPCVASAAVCGSVLQRVAVRCSVVQCLAVCCSGECHRALCCNVLQSTAMWCSLLRRVSQRVAASYSVLQCAVAADATTHHLTNVPLIAQNPQFSVLQCVAMFVAAWSVLNVLWYSVLCCSVLQCVAVCWDVMPETPKKNGRDAGVFEKHV